MLFRMIQSKKVSVDVRMLINLLIRLTGTGILSVC